MISDHIKLLFVENYPNHSIGELSKAFKITRQTCFNWRREFDLPRKKRGRQKGWNNAAKLQLAAKVAEKLKANGQHNNE